MQKKETIWRHILEETLKKPVSVFTQKDIAKKFGISTSTVFNALKIPRQLSAVEITGRYFRIKDAEKLLMIWATHRNLNKEMIYKTKVSASAREIEGMMPPNIIFGAYSAYRFAFDETPADYSAVYIYAEDLTEIEKRFPIQKGTANLYVLKKDDNLDAFGKLTPASQIFVDLWNLPEWYAKDYRSALKEKMNL